MKRRRRRKPKWTPEQALVGPLDRQGRAIVAEGEEGRPREARVDGALAGESVEFLRFKRKGPIDIGLVREVFEPAETRVEARCPHYGVCGGCSLMHMDPAAQIAFKQEILLGDFEAAGVRPERVLEPLVGPRWHYRRRARLGAKLVPRKEKVVVGFREKDSRFIADLGTCELLAAPSKGPLADDPGQLIPALSELIGGLSIAAKLPQIEVSVGDHEMALVLRVLEPPSEADLDALRAFEHQYALRIFLQSKGLDTVAPLDPEGASTLRYGIPSAEVDLEFRPTDFVQINSEINRAMIERAIELLEIEPGHRVLDLFCGLGNFSLPLARRAGFVVGIEGDEALVERARSNASANGLANTAFERRDLYTEDATLSYPEGPFDRVLLDPPRSGAAAVVENFEAIAAPRVVYVACSPSTLARDAATLCERHGYRLVAAGVMDMFPHTAHVESIALFERG